jgi:hypothetical protein
MRDAWSIQKDDGAYVAKERFRVGDAPFGHQRNVRDVWLNDTGVERAVIISHPSTKLIGTITKKNLP